MIFSNLGIQQGNLPLAFYVIIGIYSYAERFCNCLTTNVGIARGGISAMDHDAESVLRRFPHNAHIVDLNIDWMCTVTQIPFEQITITVLSFISLSSCSFIFGECESANSSFQP